MAIDRVISRVKKRGNQWFCRIKRTGPNGIAHDLCHSDASRIKVEIWEKKVIQAIDTGNFQRKDFIQKKKTAEFDPIHARTITFSEALERYKSTITIHKKGAEKEAAKIGKLQRDDLTEYSKLADRPLIELGASNFALWRDERIQKGSAPATVRRYLAIVSHLYVIARKEWGMKDLTNPISDISKPKVKNERSRRLDPKEEQYLRAAMIDNPDVKIYAGVRNNKYIAPIVSFALETAMRQGEILSLKWEQIDINKQTAYLMDTKNGEDRSVPLSSRAITILESLQDQHTRRLKGRVFATTQTALRQSWVRAIKRAKRAYISGCKNTGQEIEHGFLENLRFHDLRHEATSRLAEMVPNVLALASITGHKDLKMLKRYYHPKTEDLAKMLG
ncbi:MAG: site-specific integrase [Pseudomonadota bacterium]|nr:site-specific integrase [Pseudomonadota bacterium]